jgi:hypothetical protein
MALFLVVMARIVPVDLRLRMYDHAGQRLFRRSGYRFTDKNKRHQKARPRTEMAARNGRLP